MTCKCNISVEKGLSTKIDILVLGNVHSVLVLTVGSLIGTAATK